MGLMDDERQHVGGGTEGGFTVGAFLYRRL